MLLLIKQVRFVSYLPGPGLSFSKILWVIYKYKKYFSHIESFSCGKCEFFSQIHFCLIMLKLILIRCLFEPIPVFKLIFIRNCYFGWVWASWLLVKVVSWTRSKFCIFFDSTTQTFVVVVIVITFERNSECFASLFK